MSNSEFHARMVCKSAIVSITRCIIFAWAEVSATASEVKGGCKADFATHRKLAPRLHERQHLAHYNAVLCGAILQVMEHLLLHHSTPQRHSVHDAVFLGTRLLVAYPLLLPIEGLFCHPEVCTYE